MIKILFAVGRLSVGGGEKLLIHQLKNLDRFKFEPYLLTLFPETEESLASGVDLSAERWQKNFFRGLWDLSAWLRLFQFLKKENFDAVVTSLFSANMMVRTVLLFLKRPKVIISYEHNIYPDKKKWQIWIDKILAGITDKIIVDAKSVVDFTSRQESIPADKFVVMYIPPLAEVEPPLGGSTPPAGGSTSENFRKEFGIASEDKVILTVSRLVEEKGHKYLIEAAAKVIKEFPSAKFLIVGWGGLKEKLAEQIKSSGLDKKVMLAGRRDIAEMLPLAVLYVEPALSVDIGIASMEAMAFGLPVVSTNVGEMPVFVKDGENGFLVGPADSAMLAEKILILLEDDAMCQKMGEKAKETVKDFSLERYMQKFEDLIMSLINRK